ncbi:MAG: transcriptional regulator [Thermoproteota archaeon]
MNNDRALGALLLLGSIVAVIIYFWLVFISPWSMVILQLTAFIAVDFVLLIIAWIGYTLATTPSPQPMEEIEKEVRAEETPPPPQPPTEEKPKTE